VLIHFDKERLLEYLDMYKSNNSFKMNVLKTLNKEQILEKIQDPNIAL